MWTAIYCLEAKLINILGTIFGNHYVQGALIGAGLLALFQNLFNYRIDTEFLEYVYDPLKTFIMRFFGSKSLAIIEARGKTIAADVHAQLTNLLVSGETDGAKVLTEVKKIFDNLKTKL